MKNESIWIIVQSKGIFSCTKEVMQTTRPVIIAVQDRKVIIIVRVLDFGPFSGDPDAPTYAGPSLEKITPEDLGVEASPQEAREFLKKMGEENIFLANRSF